MNALAALNERRWPPAPTPKLLNAAASALISRTWTDGPATRAAEEALTQATGAPHAIMFQSCTAALHAALIAHGVRPGTPVHTPAFGFAGTLTGAAHTRAALLYHDTHPDTGQSVDPYAADTALILTPDLHGAPHGLTHPRLITDSCQSLGTRMPDGQPRGATGTHAWSFSASKLIPAPDGGAITTTDRALADELRQLRDYGTDPGAARANALVTRRGHNWRPSELSMALIAAQLANLPAVARRAHETGEALRATLAETGLWHQQTPDGALVVWHKIRTGHPTNPGAARRLRSALTDAGIPTHTWGAHPLPAHPVFSPDRGDLPPIPNAKALAANTFCLGTEACPPWTWTDQEVTLVRHTIEMIMEHS